MQDIPKINSAILATVSEKKFKAEIAISLILQFALVCFVSQFVCLSWGDI